ncbi:hypothetical protein COV61_00505 [Candidatus Micrarchaeota archaeon CG11_big_fil_rev_8_21_14_0_20_47_5]|nr:MAG: hypothetical protein AUJ17_03450 [Candidatus Micrarchaeota archaeon CG1_02_47_40]PIN84293.1 MAG: hypothetical protein COV61_00505 [Candidatus Micrarchaeota archaeon CG11_big_fil_rev_8_21_14_0_20_47_5]
MPSITRVFSNIALDGPTVGIRFHIPIELEKKMQEEGMVQIPAPVEGDALIDTGASNCVIQEDIPKKLGLQPMDVVKINTPSCEGRECYRYFIRLIIPDQKIIYQGVFTAAPLKGQKIACLLGRDLLQHGVFIYIGYANEFTLSLG